MTETLYQRIGEKGLESLLNRFYDCVFSNDILLPLFNNTDRVIIQRKQLMFLSQFLGGPMLYTETYGAPQMRQRHCSGLRPQSSLRLDVRPASTSPFCRAESPHRRRSRLRTCRSRI